MQPDMMRMTPEMALESLQISHDELVVLTDVAPEKIGLLLNMQGPVEALDKLQVITEIAILLSHYLKPGMPAIVFRRQAPAYQDRTMLEMIAAGEHAVLLDDVRESFNFNFVA